MLSLKVIKEIYATDGLNEAKKAFSELGSPLDSFVGKATLATAAAYALYKGIQALSDKYNLSYASAIKNTEESLSSFSSTKTEVEDLKTQVDTAKDSLTSIADTYNIEITGTESVTELIDKLKNANLSLEDRAQVSQIEQENASIERQIALKEKLLEYQQKEAASNAMDTMGRAEQSVAQQVAQKVPGGKKTYQGMVDNVGVVDAVKEDVKAIRDYETAIASLEKKQASFDPGSKEWKEAEKDIQSYNKAIQTLTSDLDTKEADLTTLLKSFSVDGEGLTALTGYEEQFNAIKDALNSINNIDLTPAQQQLASIQSFFDGSTGKNFLKDELLEIAKSGDITEDSLSRMGLSLEDIGVSGEEGLSALNRYFKDLVGSVNEAKDSVEGFNGSLESIVSASETENQDSKWNTVSDLFDKAKELDKNKKWGTDDFQSMARFIAPEGTLLNIKNTDLKAKDYKDLWDTYNANFKKYFDSDNPLQSAINAQDKLISSGLGSMDSSGIITWSENFKTSAQAAEAWGISVEAAEIAMRNLESYGAEFDGVTFSKENLDEYKSSLEGIRSIYESMGEGSQKDRLGKLISGWDEEFAKYEQDLSTLSEDQVVKIKFEYDLASIQSQIDEVKALIESGDDTVENNAQVIAGNQKYINTAEKGLGFDVEGVTIPVEYEANENTIEALKSQLKKATKEDKVKIQAEIENLQELQKNLLNAFSDAHPEINADSSVEEINAAWNDFVSSAEGQEIIANITANDEDAKKKIAELLGIDIKDITVDVKAEDNASDVISSVLSELMGIPKEKVAELIANDNASSEVISFLSTISGIPESTLTQMNAEDGATATITYVMSQISNVPESKISQMIAEDNATGIINSIQTSISSLPTSKKITITTIKETINKVSSWVSSGVNPNLKQFMSGTMLSPARASGTAYNVLNTQPISKAFANGKVALQKDERALVNEEYFNGHSESIVRDGVWRLIPGGTHFENLKKGDIVFSASQTEALLRNGRISGHARTYASGSLLAPAYGNGMLSLGGSYGKSYGKSYSSTTSKKSTNTATQAAQTASEVAEDLYNFVEILLTRTKELTKRLTDAIDDAVSLSDKMSKNSSALSQIQKEISVNQQAYQKYLAQANVVELDDPYKKQIREGSLNIENITDENLKKNIDKYKEYYELALKAQDAVRDLQKEEKQLALDRLDYIKDYYDAIEKLNSAYRDVNDTRIELNNALGVSAIGDEIKLLLQSSYDKQYESYNKALTQLSDYQSEFLELVRNGYIEEGSDAWYEGQATIQEFTKQVDEAAIALIELEDKIREIDYTRLQQIIDGSDRRTDQLKNAQSLAEARDEQIGRDEYQKQIDELSKSINANYELRDKKIQEQNLYDVTSTRYQELAEEISKIDGEIYSSLEDIEDLKNKIFETEFFNYEKEQENIKYFIDELNDFASLLNEDAFFTKDGAFTDEAYAKIALTADAMSKCKQQIANATEALNKLDEMYQNGLISETEYTDKQRELLNSIRDNVSATESYKKELLDLYVTQARKENEALKKNIDLQKKRLQNQKDYWDYAESLKSKTKTVNEIEAQIAALQGVKLFAHILFKCGDIPIILIRYNGTGNGKRECGACLKHNSP